MLGTQALGQLAGRVIPGVQTLAPADGVGPVDSVMPALNTLDAVGSAVMLAALLAIGVLVVRKRVRGAIPAAALLAAARTFEEIRGAWPEPPASFRPSD